MSDESMAKTYCPTYVHNLVAQNKLYRDALQYIDNLDNEMPSNGTNELDFFRFQLASAQNKASDALEIGETK